MNLTAEERLKWWHEARFGMFIHWGLYAVLAGEWNGKKQKSIGEWIMHDLQIPIDEYEKLAPQFNPVKFDAEAWAQLAQDAGMKYLVITSKHHDGFCMFDSKTNPYNIVNKTPFKRDPMKELAAACNKRGISMCFYYSQDLDWHAPGGGGHWEERDASNKWLSYTRPPEDFQKYLDEVVKPNLRELLTNYGPIGLIWFDVPVTITKQQSESLRDLVHELQPGCLVSGRVGHDVGDYGSLGDNEHPVGKVKGAWETPATLNDTWGFKKDDHDWKSLDYLIDLLVNCASKGVNYLLNVGPTAEGIIPQPSVDRLREVGGWMQRNGDAIYGTQASPFMTDPEWGRVTAKGNSIYLLVKKWSSNIEVFGLKNKIVSARLLGGNGGAITFTQAGDRASFALPANAPEATVSVIAVTLDRPAEAEQLVFQNGKSPIVLPAALADFDRKIKLHSRRGTEGWTDASCSASWAVRVRTAGEYEVRVTTAYHSETPELTGQHDVRLSLSDGSSVAGLVGHHDPLPRVDDRPFQHAASVLGRVRLNADTDYTLKLVAERLDPAATLGLRLVSLELKRVD